jgi:hypothetical protein
MRREFIGSAGVTAISDFQTKRATRFPAGPAVSRAAPNAPARARMWRYLKCRGGFHQWVYREDRLGEDFEPRVRCHACGKMRALRLRYVARRAVTAQRPTA